MKYRSAILEETKIRLQIACLSFLLTACTYTNIQPVQIQPETFESKGVITGADMRMCPSPCCGGWDITVNKEYYTFSALPQDSGMDLDKQKFPLAVKLNWKLDSICYHHIAISKIALDQ